MEMAVFAGLGFAGVFMLSLALIETSRFVAGSDQIAAALANPRESLAAASANGGNAVATNLMISRRQRIRGPAVARASFDVNFQPLPPLRDGRNF